MKGHFWVLFVWISLIVLSVAVLGQEYHGSPEHLEDFEALNVTSLKTPAYVGVENMSINVTLMDDTLKMPTRIKISADGKYMFVAELYSGEVILYVREDSYWHRQKMPFYDVGDLNVEGERGMTGLFFGAGFDPDAEDPVLRDVFVTYQIYENDKFRNRITRVTFTKTKNGTYSGADPQMIYEGPRPGSSAHQIQDGIGFEYEGAPHILVSIGDGKMRSFALNASREGNGKLLLMQRDGSDPLGPRPFPEYPNVQAIGLRNTYGILMLPASIDSRRRIFGAENGESKNDRLWFLEAVDFGHEEDAQVSLGWSGSDSDRGWTSVIDVNTPGPIKPEAVVALLSSPIVSPTSVSLHPGKGVIPKSKENEASILIVYYGKTGSKENKPGKEIVLGHLTNLGNQPFLDLIPIIERSPEAEGTLGNPVAMDVDPTTGDIYFADIITGELYRAVIEGDESDGGQLTGMVTEELDNTFSFIKKGNGATMLLAANAVLLVILILVVAFKMKKMK